MRQAFFEITDNKNGPSKFNLIAKKIRNHWNIKYMYHSHYNFNQRPFQMTADPKFIWLGKKHAEALTTLQNGLHQSKRLLVLTGNVGTGKTAIINLF